MRLGAAPRDWFLEVWCWRGAEAALVIACVPTYPGVRRSHLETLPRLSLRTRTPLLGYMGCKRAHSYHGAGQPFRGRGGQGLQLWEGGAGKVQAQVPSSP